MVLIREDGKILASDEVRELQNRYAEKFGEDFLCFNYADFPSSGTKIAGEVYRDALREAVARDEPTHIVSHRYDEFDH